LLCPGAGIKQALVGWLLRAPRLQSALQPALGELAIADPLGTRNNPLRALVGYIDLVEIGESLGCA
jgi:hypothetical protein